MKKSCAALVDFIYSKGESNEIILKELAYIDLRGKIAEKASFSPPYSIDRLDEKNHFTAKWSQKYLQTLPFTAEGDLVYSELHKMLIQLVCSLPKDTVIYVKGTEKCKFLNDYFSTYPLRKPAILEMETELKTPALQVLQKKNINLYMIGPSVDSTEIIVRTVMFLC